MKKTKNRKLKIAAMLVALALVLGIGGFSASRLVQASAFDSARNAARGAVPTAAERMKEERDDDNYEFEFYDELYDEYYQVSVDKKDRSQIKVTSRVETVQVTQQIERTREEVEALVRTVYPGAEITSVSLSEYEQGYVYKVVFAGDTVRGQVSVHPQSGQIISRSLRYGSSILVMTNAIDEDDDAIKPLSDRYISLEQARLIALEAVPNASIHEMEYGEDDDRLTIEVEMTREGWEFEVTIDAQTGDVMEIERDDGALQTQPTEPGTTHPTTEDNDDRDDDWDDDRDDDRDTTSSPTPSRSEETTTSSTEPKATETQPAPALIGADRAAAIVLAKIPGAEFVEKIELERDDGRLYYEGEARKSGYEYEFEIDAYTGVIIDWDADEIDADDDDDGHDDDDDEDDD